MKAKQQPKAPVVPAPSIEPARVQRVDHYDTITLECEYIERLVDLIDVVLTAVDEGDTDLPAETACSGLAVVARSLNERTKAIRVSARALLGGAR